MQTDNLRGVFVVVSLSLNFTTTKTPHKLRLTAVLDLKGGTSISESLFKYREINKGSLELLLNQELWFAEPGALNDPFECQEIAEDIFNSVWANYEIEVEKKERIRTGLNRQLQQTGICSFSSAKKNQLMWAHYADEHRGFCISFNKDKLNLAERQIAAYEVNYQDDFPFKGIIERIERSKDHPDLNTPDIIATDILSSIVSTKYTYWKYEREVRLVKLWHGAEKFHPLSLSAITFGLRTSDRDKRTIRRILSGSEWGHVKWFECRKSKSKFALEFERI